MRLYKRKRTGRDGKAQRSSVWWVDFHDAKHGLTRSCPGYRDKGATRELGRHLERLAACAAARRELDSETRLWLDGQPETMRKRLLRWSLIDGQRAAAARTLQDHVADYAAHLRQRGYVRQHVETVEAKLRRLLDLAGITYWSEMTASTMQRAVANVTHTRREQDDKGNVRDVQRPLRIQSRNHYVTTAKAFANWMVADGRASASPLSSLKRQTVTDATERRAATPNELARLIAAAHRGEPFRWWTSRRGRARAEKPRSIDGPERALLYRLAVETGLRAGELRGLVCSDFELDTKPAYVKARASTTKNRKEARIALRDSTAAMIRAHVAHKLPSAQVFNVPPFPSKPMRADLEAAGVAYRDAQGRTLDFHALRHTFITNVANSGAPVKVIQELARHSTPSLTIGRYAHADDDQKASAIAALPDLPDIDAEAQRATGTTGDLGDCSADRFRAHIDRAELRGTAQTADKRDIESSRENKAFSSDVQAKSAIPRATSETAESSYAY